MDFAWSEEQSQLFDGARAFAASLPTTIESPEAFRAGFRQLGEFGALGLCVDDALGGMGLDSLTSARTVEALGQGCPELGLLFSAAAHLFACVVPIAEHASEELAARVVPRLCSGEWVGANAITEAEAGSDIGRLRTRATREGDEYVLDGVKSYVTNGPAADVFMVYATVNPEFGFMGVTGFVVERDRPGLKVGDPFETMGLEGSPISSVYLDGCRVPVANRVGEEGSGSTIFSESMHYERTCLLAAWLGSMDRTLNRAI